MGFRVSGIGLPGFIITFFLYLSFPTSASASDTGLGPSFEIGGGLMYAQSNNYPDWSTKNYRMGTINGAVRFFRGLAFQGGYDSSLGEDVHLKSLTYGDEIRLEKLGVSNYETSWFAFRYEVPMRALKRDLFRIQTVYTSLGISWARYTLTSSQCIKNGIREIDQSETRYHIADMRGPIAVLGARWRMDTDVTQGTGSWLGAYGIDAGVRYIRYDSYTPAHDTIEKPAGDVAVLQVFVIGFLKIRWFE